MAKLSGTWSINYHVLNDRVCTPCTSPSPPLIDHIPLFKDLVNNLNCENICSHFCIKGKYTCKFLKIDDY